MKKIIIWSGVALICIGAAIAIARAASPGRRWGCPGWRHRGPFAFVVRQLDLSNSQESQIKAVWQAERPTVGSLLQEFVAENREMDSATAQGHLDEAAVQAISDRQARTIAKLLVEKERFQSKVYTTVLTPEQRSKADMLRNTWDARLESIAAKVASGAEPNESHP